MSARRGESLKTLGFYPPRSNQIVQRASARNDGADPCDSGPQLADEACPRVCAVMRAPRRSFDRTLPVSSSAGVATDTGVRATLALSRGPRPPRLPPPVLWPE